MKPYKWHWRPCLVTMAAALVTCAAQAQTAVYSNPNPASGNQGWAGMLGNDFTVNSGDLAVTEIGVFTGLTPGFAPGTTIIARLFDITDINSIMAVSSQLTFTNAVPGLGTPYAFVNVAPITLTAGRTYSIQSSGWSGADPNFNTNIGGATQTFNNLGGAITQGLGRFAQAGALGVAGESGNWSFGGGNVVITAVPEPQAYALALVAVGLLAAGARIKRQA